MKTSEEIKEAPVLEFKEVKKTSGEGTGVWVANCLHIGQPEYKAVGEELLVPVGEHAYVFLCEKCATAIEYSLLKTWAGLKANSRTITTPELPPYEVLRETLSRKAVGEDVE